MTTVQASGESSTSYNTSISLCLMLIQQLKAQNKVARGAYILARFILNEYLKQSNNDTLNLNLVIMQQYSLIVQSIIGDCYSDIGAMSVCNNLD